MVSSKYSEKYYEKPKEDNKQGGLLDEQTKKKFGSAGGSSINDGDLLEAT